MRLLLVTSLLASTALAQTSSLNEDLDSRGVVLPPTNSAIVEDATALRINPSALTQVGALELFYAHEFRAVNAPDWYGADGLYLAGRFPGIGYGLAAEWVSGRGLLDARRLSWGLAAGGERLSLGVTLATLQSTERPDLDDDLLVDVGAQSRLNDHLSLAFVGRNLNARSAPYSRSYEAAVAVRPFDDRFTLGVDYRYGDANWLGGKLGYTLQATLWRGVHLSAGVSHGLSTTDPLAFHLGLGASLGRLGAFTSVGVGGSGPSASIGVRASTQRYPSVPSPGGSVVLLDLADRLRGDGSTVGMLLGATEDDPFVRTLELIDAASEDDQLTGVVLKLDALSDTSMAKIEELRQAIFRLRAKGKHVSAVLMTVQDPEYLLATAADEILALPQSLIAVNGLMMRSRFLGGTLEKVGVTVDVARVGAYKNAPDAFTRKDMSPEQREALTALLDAETRALEKGITEARKIDAAALQEAMRRGLLSASLAKELRLVDEVITTQQLEKKLEKQFPTSRYEPRYSPGGVRDPSWSERRRIAVVPIVGTIDSGKSRRAPLGDGMVAGAETVVRAINRAAEDPNVVAIVLRVDSGGGGVLASDLMYRAALDARDDKKKIVIASMGDVAASGGYYVAAAADEIFASPATITGSIGVFMVKPALKGLYDKLGISQEAIQRGDASDILGEYKPWTELERAEAQRWVDTTYDQFITLVSERRKLDKAKVDELARGRVWSGEDAKARGLVDTFGGLWDAIASARARAGIPDSERLDIRIYGEPRGFLSAPGGEEGVFAPLMSIPVSVPGTQLPPVAKRVLDLLGPDTALFSSGVQARMEFDVHVD